jgi:hypothetical protein
MNCSDCQNMVLPWLHGLLDDSESVTFGSHLKDCPACTQLVNAEKTRQKQWKGAVRSTYPEMVFTPPDVKILAKPTSQKLMMSVARYALAASLLLVAGLGIMGVFNSFRVESSRARLDADRQLLAQAQDKQSNRLWAQYALESSQETDRNKIIAQAVNPQLNLVVHGPASWVAGASSTYRIEAVGPGGEMRKAKISTRMENPSSKGSFVSLDLKEKPDGAHELTLPPDFVLTAGMQPILEISAQSEDPATKALVEVKESVPLGLPALVTHLATDRRLYLPGETVRFRSLTLERATLKPAHDQLGLSFRLVRPDGSTVQLGEGDGRVRQTENGSVAQGPSGQAIVGIGTGEFTLEADAPGGEYTLHVSDTSRRFAPRERKFLVQEYQPQRLAKELIFNRRSYGPGDTVEVMLKGASATGQPLSGSTVELMLRVDDMQFNASGKESGEMIPLMLDGQGKGSVRLILPKLIRKGDVTLTAIFSDGANRETLVKPVPMVLKNVIVEFFAEGGDLVPGAEARVYFSARSPLGKPAEIRGRLLEDGKALPGEVSTYSDSENPGSAQGLGVVSFTPVAGRAYEIELTSPESGIRHPLPKLAPQGTALRAVAGQVPGEPIAVSITAAKPARHLVGLYSRGQLLDSKVLEPGSVRVDLKPPTSSGGVGRVTVFRMESAGGNPELIPVAERLVWIPSKSALSVEMTVSRAGSGAGDLAPGDQARLTVKTRDASGASKPALALLSVVDRSNVILADEKSARSMPTHFLLGEEVRHAADLEYSDFLISGHPRAREAIDLLLGVQGWRRFAEQDPAKFQRQFPVEADNYLISAGQKDHRSVHTAHIALERSLAQHDAAVLQLLKPANAAISEAQEEVKQVEDTVCRAGELLATHTERQRTIGMIFRGAVILTCLLAALSGLMWVLSWLTLASRIISVGAFLCGGLVMAFLNPAFFIQTVSTMSEFVQSNNDAGRAIDARALTEAAPAPMAQAAEFMDKPSPGPPGAAVFDKPLPGAAPAVEMGAVMEGFGAKARSRFSPPANRNLALPGPIQKPGAAMARANNMDKVPGIRRPGEQLAKRNGMAALPQQMRQEGEAMGARRMKNIAGGMPMGGMPVLGADAKFDRELNNILEHDPRARIDRPMLVREYAHARLRGQDTARTDFTETLLWQPVAVLADGSFSKEFDLCDSVTRFQAVAMVHTEDGELAQATVTFDSRLPLSMSLKVPFEVTASDTIRAVAAIEGRPGIDKVRLDPATLTGAVLEGPGAEELPLSKEGRARRVLTLRPGLLDQEIGYGLEMTGGGFSDSIKGKVRIVPEGFPVEGALSDRLSGSLERTLRFPKEWVQGSLSMRIEAYPSPTGELLKGLDGMLREPHGCFEQTSSTNYPNVMILAYLKESGLPNPEAESRARELLAKGYGRLIGFECQDTKAGKKHGFEWFGASDQQHEALTAYGLLQFADMQSVGVEGMDKDLVSRTRSFLMQRRDGQGGFVRNPRNLDRFGAAPTPITNAYIVWSLTETGSADELKKEIDAVRDAAAGSPDMYLKALATIILLNAGRNEEAVPFVKSLMEAQDAEGKVVGGQSSVTRSTGQCLEIETTALACLAWMKAGVAGAHVVSASKAGGWLAKQRDGLGAYGTTQSTVLALKALVGQARASKREIKAGEIKLSVGDKVFAKAFGAGVTETVSIAIPDAERVFKPGDNPVRFEITGGNAMPASLTWRYHTLIPPTSPKAILDLQTKLDRTTLREGESARLNVAVTNKSNDGQGMAIAVIGLPAGMNIPTDGKQLIDLCRIPTDGSRAKLSQWEVHGRELVLYWRDMAPSERIELSLDVEARVPGIYRGPSSRAYLYYTPEHRIWVEPLKVTINPAS